MVPPSWLVTAMNAAEQVLREIEAIGSKSFIPIIGPKKGKILEAAVRERKPKLVLEVGTLVGYSAILMARFLPKDGRIISIEMDRNSAEIARRNIGKAGFSGKTEVIVGDAKHVIPRFNEFFDLVFIDATKEEYLTYLKLVEAKLRRGSVVVADNAGIFADRLAEYLAYVRNSGKYRSRYYESTLEFNDNVKDGVEVSTKL